eukprot:TRINITY_DN2846_c0_g1_i1.p1 TRINITY_DN2846_c0_g1~~TRINITY_DN2846_c0_g1_i1.p1  ORF type:complete len:147 (+),score=15.13 TRINITY_DN2846_c0_g1_i1:38-478(+)
MDDEAATASDLTIDGNALSPIVPTLDSQSSMYDRWSTNENRTQRPLDGPRAELMKRVIGNNVLVEMCDGRLVSGTFQCTDRDMNIVIQQAVEYRLKAMVGESVSNNILGAAPLITYNQQEYSSVRYLGVISLPGDKLKGLAVTKAA